MEFTQLYKEYGEKIYRVCLGFVNDADKAKDLTQETFIAVFQHISSFRNEAQIGSWIYKIATNKCLRSIENEKKERKFDAAFLYEDSGLKTEGERKIIFLRRCISELAEVDRIIISLSMEDIAQEKIAEITGLSHANVRVRVHRIKERILKKFKANGEF